MDAVCVVQSEDVLGECPVWSEERHQLLWLDLAAPRIHIFDPASGAHQSRSLGGSSPLGGFSATSNKAKFVMGRPGGIQLLDVDTLRELPMGGVLPDDTPVYYNDAGVDRAGRLWLTTAERTETQPLAGLLKLDGLRCDTVESGFVVGNGPSFSVDGDLMFVSDSLGRRLLAYDLDPSGQISGRRTIAEFDEDMGYPDGLAVDTNHGVWVAHWDGGAVTRWSFDGQQTDRITVPTKNVTSVAFGGAKLDCLYITTAADETGGEGGGNLYCAIPGVVGAPETLFRVKEEIG